MQQTWSVSRARIRSEALVWLPCSCSRWAHAVASRRNLVPRAPGDVRPQAARRVPAVELVAARVDRPAVAAERRAPAGQRVAPAAPAEQRAAPVEQRAAPAEQRAARVARPAGPVEQRAEPEGQLARVEPPVRVEQRVELRVVRVVRGRRTAAARAEPAEPEVRVERPAKAVPMAVPERAARLERVAPEAAEAIRRSRLLRQPVRTSRPG
jgi:hypothetical protein